MEITYDTSLTNKAIKEILNEKDEKDEIAGDSTRIDTRKVTYIGIETLPYFIDRETNQLLPHLFAEIRFNIEHAMRRTVSCFINSNTTHTRHNDIVSLAPDH